MRSPGKFWRRLWPAKIRTQLICGIALVHLVLMTVFVVDLVARQRDFLKKQSLEQTTSLVSTLAVNSTSWVLANDVAGLEEIVLAIGQYPDLRYAMVMAPDGKILAHTDQAFVGQHVTDEKSVAALNAESTIQVIHAGRDALDIAAPILTPDGQRIGWARIAEGQGQIVRSLVSISRNGIFYTILAIVLGSILALILGNRLTLGLNRLLAIFSQTENGRRDLRVEDSGRDELAKLGQGFNRMLDVLVANEESNRRNHQRLESLANILQLEVKNQQELLDYALKEAIRLTGSQWGEIFFYREDDQKFTLSNQSGHMAGEGADPQAGDSPLKATGLWSEIVRQRQAVLVNDLQGDPRRGQAPLQGPAQFANALGIPVFAEKKIVAVVGVANKDVGYVSEDITQLTLLMDAVWALVQRRNIEEALRLSESRVHSISNNLTRGMIYQLISKEDGSRKFTFVSGSVQKLYGITPEEALADAGLIYNRVHKDEIQGLIEAENRAAKTLSQFTAEVRIVEPSGAIRWSSLASSPTRMEDGSLCWDGIELVVTERKEVEQALARAAREWSTAMDASADVICLLDMNRRIIRANRAFYDVTGATPETVLGQPLVHITHPGGEHLPCRICEAQEEHVDLQMILEADEHDNPLGRPVEVTVKVIRDDDQPVSMLMTYHDLSAARQEMEERAVLEKQLQQAQKMESVGRLAGGVAHDFNNMLGVIIGYSELAIAQTDPGQPVHGFLDEIHKAAHRSAELTRQLLAFARKQTIEPRVLDLNVTIEGMLKMLRRLIGEDIALSWQPGAELWPVKMDPSQIDQILANLCVNARDAISGTGHLMIQTESRVVDEGYCLHHPTITPGDYVLLSVSDDGCGMDQATLGHIFEPFFTTKGVGSGTGLGLATVYGIVQQNNGFVHAYSELGRGTTFTVYLPRYRGGDGTEGLQSDSGVVLAPQGHARILLVEDEAAILAMATAMLESLGYSVLGAGSPVEALELASRQAGDIHLLMTDVIMPEMNGRELAARLSLSRPGLKILFMSGYTDDVLTIDGVLDEKMFFLQKPFTLSVLAAKVREALDGDEGRGVDR